ncbi:MAG: hypothetical protein HC888_12915 [Candidatus Competibacteraceae bacterium]|nr:hypothetical protein [Candidatus Competibacteraceae bacterium]
MEALWSSFFFFILGLPVWMVVGVEVVAAESVPRAGTECSDYSPGYLASPELALVGEGGFTVVVSSPASAAFSSASVSVIFNWVQKESL